MTRKYMIMAKTSAAWFRPAAFALSLFLLCFGVGCGTELPGVGTGGTQNSGGHGVSTGGIRSTGGSITMGGTVGSTGGIQSAGGSVTTSGTAGSTGGIQSVGGSATMGGDIGNMGGTVGSTGGIQSTGGVVGNTGGGTVGNMGGMVGSTGGTTGSTGGTVGSTGGIVGRTGGIVGSMGGTIGSTGGTVGRTGGTVGSTGGTVGSTGGTVGSTGGTVGSTGGTVGSTGGTVVGTGGTVVSMGGTVGSTGGGVVIGGRDAGNPDSGTADASQNIDSSTPGDTAVGYDSGVPQYKLVWSDEFDTDGPPNPNNWGYETGFVRNKELQWYTSSNATVKNGLLVIEARKEQVLNPNYQEGSSDWTKSRRYAEYTSASLTSYQLQSWKYGRFEMRARIPVDAGAWPAWWTLGLTGEWPSGGEIDIMEYYAGNLLTDVACGTSQQWVAKWNSATKSLSSLGGSDWASSFHTWRMDWDDQKIGVYLDDVLLNSVALSDMLNADGTSPFVLPQYMLLNLAVGSQGGDPTSTVFPVRYEIDWVRVFQLL